MKPILDFWIRSNEIYDWLPEPKRFLAFIGPACIALLCDMLFMLLGIWENSWFFYSWMLVAAIWRVGYFQIRRRK